MGQRKFKNGQEVILSDSAPVWAKQIFGDTVLTISSYRYGGYSGGSYVINYEGGNYELKSNQLKSAVGRKSKKEHLLSQLVKKQNEIKTLNEDINSIQSRLDYIEETGSEDFDENEYKAYKVLRMIESKELSTFEQAKEIAKLINK